LLLKRLLNCLWGKAIWKGMEFHDEYVEPGDVDGFIERNPLVFSQRKTRDGKIRMRLIKSVYMPYQKPEFAVPVLSWSRKVVHEWIYMLVDDGSKVYYSNTDSLLVDGDAWVRLTPELGDFHVEHRFVRFICLSAKRYLRVYEDGHVENSFGKRSLEWFENEYSGSRSRVGVLE
jgi:hypothetical protein